jgi:hypothetical protein
MNIDPKTTTLGPRMKKYFAHMETNKYRLEKDIGHYLMYSFMEHHCAGYPQIHSEVEHKRVMKNLFENFDNLPNHVDKVLLKREFLEQGKTLVYAAGVYPPIVKSIALSMSKANSQFGEGNYTDIVIKTSELEEVCSAEHQY